MFIAAPKTPGHLDTGRPEALPNYTGSARNSGGYFDGRRHQWAPLSGQQPESSAHPTGASSATSEDFHMATDARHVATQFNAGFLARTFDELELSFLTTAEVYTVSHR